MAISKGKIIIEMCGRQVSMEEIERRCKKECPRGEYVYINTYEGNAYVLSKDHDADGAKVKLID